MWPYLRHFLIKPFASPALDPHGEPPRESACHQHKASSGRGHSPTGLTPTVVKQSNAGLTVGGNGSKCSVWMNSSNTTAL